MKRYLIPLLLAIAGLCFLIPTIRRIADGESIRWSLDLATAIGMLLAAVVACIVIARRYPRSH